MKTTKILVIFVLVLGLVVCLATVSWAEPMGTAWAYQGRLIDANEAADGEYDFQFKLYDDVNATTGIQQGSTIDINDLDVMDGYFTVELDFGSSVFTGDARWLETAVRPGDSNDPNAFITLNPRQVVTPAPYAMQSRGIFVDDTGNVGIGTTNPDSELHVDGSLRLGAGSRDFEIFEASPSDPHGWSEYIDYEGIAIGSQTGNNQQMFMFTDGLDPQNIFTVATSQNEGSSWEADFVIKQNGSVGIGTTSPSSVLDVVGDIGVSGTIDGVDLSVHAASANAHHTPPTTLPPSGPAGGDLSGTYPNPSVDNDSHTHGNGTVSDNISINNGRLYAPSGSGRVGIGTENPSSTLDVNGDVNISNSVRVKDGKVGINTPAPATNLHVQGSVIIGSAIDGKGTHQTYPRVPFEVTSQTYRSTNHLGGNHSAGNYSASFYANIIAAGYHSNSDGRLKNVISEHDGETALKNIENIKIKEFRFKEALAQRLAKDQDRVYTGVIAQEVEQVLPDAVSTGLDILDEDGNILVDSAKTVDNDRLIFEHIAATQQLYKIIKLQKSRISSLEKQNRKLEERLNTIENKYIRFQQVHTSNEITTVEEAL